MSFVIICHYFFLTFFLMCFIVSLSGSLLFLYCFQLFQCFALFFFVVFFNIVPSGFNVSIVFFSFSIVFQVLSPVYIVLLHVFIGFNFNVFVVFSSEMFIAFPFFQVLFIVFDWFSGFICFIVYLTMFSFFSRLFIVCFLLVFVYVPNTYLSITVGILNILPFLFGHFDIFKDVSIFFYVFHHFFFVPSVVARFLGRCSREEPGRPVTGSMSSSSVDYNDIKMIAINDTRVCWK